MRLLNLACGAVRPQEGGWWNVDDLEASLAPGTPERVQLDSEKNYINANIAHPLPFINDHFDGVLCSHAIEHFDCQTSVLLMGECYRILRPGGVLMVSVPDASYFRRVHNEDTVENAQRLFGEPIHLPDGETDFMGYGLFNRHHRAILTEDALWCYFVRAGFAGPWRFEYTGQEPDGDSPHTDPLFTMAKLLNRLPFSLLMTGYKT